MDTKDLESLHKALTVISKISGHNVNEILDGMTGTVFPEEDVSNISGYIQEKADWEKNICRKCWGTGQVEIQSGPYYRACVACGGSGRIPEPPAVKMNELTSAQPTMDIYTRPETTSARLLLWMGGLHF